ncbi:MAG TPA: 6-phosphogluconolactonase [Candidatus Saccharimonadales bacterium]|nr:6-phosphogluconolactonase [Candidatus Saccharimonadales bacterium]
MLDVQIEKDDLAVAKAAAEMTAAWLDLATAKYRDPVWALSGGSTPMKAYSLLAQNYKDKIDWQSLKFIIGDERWPIDDESVSNFIPIKEKLLDQVPVPKTNILMPSPARNVQRAAADYERLLSRLAADEKAIPRIDVLWLGVGEDGHTLSLFPGKSHDNLSLVTYELNSPKPPPQRISLNYRILGNVRNCVIMATGEAKKAVVSKILSNDPALPICQAIDIILSSGGHISLLLDKPAAGNLPLAA